VLSERGRQGDHDLRLTAGESRFELTDHHRVETTTGGVGRAVLFCQSNPAWDDRRLVLWRPASRRRRIVIRRARRGDLRSEGIV
jgi:hypothetical protein